MNVTVIKQDESVIYGGKIYTHGQSFDADDAICESLIERGYVKATAIEESTEEVELENTSYTELKKLAARKGVSATGKKDELIARIKEADATAPTEEETESEEASGDLPNTSMPE